MAILRELTVEIGGTPHLQTKGTGIQNPYYAPIRRALKQLEVDGQWMSVPNLSAKEANALQGGMRSLLRRDSEKHGYQLTCRTVKSDSGLYTLWARKVSRPYDNGAYIPWDGE